MGANKTCAIEMTFILTIFGLIWLNWFKNSALDRDTLYINIILLRKKTTTYAYNIYYLSSRFSVLGLAKFFQPETETGCRLKTGRSSKKVKHCQPKFSLEYNTLHNIEWWEKTPVIHIVFLPPCNLCILQNYFFCPLPPCCVHF